jgi:hypothetical protein
MQMALERHLHLTLLWRPSRWSLPRQSSLSGVAWKMDEACALTRMRKLPRTLRRLDFP